MHPTLQEAAWWLHIDLHQRRRLQMAEQDELFEHLALAMETFCFLEDLGVAPPGAVGHAGPSVPFVTLVPWCRSSRWSFCDLVGPCET